MVGFVLEVLELTFKSPEGRGVFIQVRQCSHLYVVSAEEAALSHETNNW